MINLDYVNEEAQITISYMPDIQENTGMGIKALSQEEAIAYRYSYALNALIDTTSRFAGPPLHKILRQRALRRRANRDTARIETFSVYLHASHKARLIPIRRHPCNSVSCRPSVPH